MATTSAWARSTSSPDRTTSSRSGHRSERGFADVRARCEREPELLRHGSGYVLYALMDAVVDRYFPVIDALEVELEQTEERIFAGGAARAQIEALYGIKQKLVTLKHAVGPMLEGTGKLHGGRVPQVCAGMGEYFRDVYDHLSRLNQSIDAIRDMVTMAMSVHLSLSTMQENETTKRLAAYGALIAVPTMIAGVYGMNFENMPELRWSLGLPGDAPEHGSDRRLPLLPLPQDRLAVDAALARPACSNVAAG